MESQVFETHPYHVDIFDQSDVVLKNNPFWHRHELHGNADGQSRSMRRMQIQLSHRVQTPER